MSDQMGKHLGIPLEPVSLQMAQSSAAQVFPECSNDVHIAVRAHERVGEQAQRLVAASKPRWLPERKATSPHQRHQTRRWARRYPSVPRLLDVLSALLSAAQAERAMQTLTLVRGEELGPL